MDPVLVTGATGRVGRAVVDQLLDAGVPVRAMTRRPVAARLPPDVEVVAGDLALPESLDAGLRGFFPRLTERRTRSFNSRIRWLPSTPRSSV
jgi:uncharacterized protein YbjT (DUF2867 family)